MNHRRTAGGNEEVTMEDHFVNVDERYLEDLKEKATRVDWLQGYIEGVDDTFNHLVELLEAHNGD